jgi:PHD/YefM family antitoxin component YafN of YafNO toxin-antitoxin module
MSVSVPSGRGMLPRMLRQVSDRHRAVVTEERGKPKAVLVSIPDYVGLAASEPEVLRLIGEESRSKGTHKLTSRQIDEIIKAARSRQPKRG